MIKEALIGQTNIIILDSVLRDTYPNNFTGVTVSGNQTELFFGDGTSAQYITNAIAITQQIQTEDDTLVMNINSYTVTCNDTAIASDSDIGYRVYFSYQQPEHELVFSGTLPVNAGVVEYTLDTTITGTYTIEFLRQTGYKTGRIEMELS